jgi:hypothetical protein
MTASTGEIYKGSYDLLPAYMEAAGSQFDVEWAGATQSFAAWTTLQTQPFG